MGKNPIIFFTGDKTLCRRDINKLKKQCSGSVWHEFSASETSEDEIRTVCGSGSLFFDTSVVVIKDIPNRKAYREFLLNLADTSVTGTRLILWDTNCHVKDTSKPPKAWSSFIKDIKSRKGSKVVDKGGDFGNSWRDRNSVVDFIQKQFMSRGKTVDHATAVLFGEIVGNNRAMLMTEIEKSCMLDGDITKDFVLENVFPSSHEAVLYKIGELIDYRKISEAIAKAREFQQNGIYHEVIAEILVRRARWQLVASYYSVQGYNDYEIVGLLMKMGRFPSLYWHNSSLREPDKLSKSSDVSDELSLKEFMFTDLGLPQDYIRGIAKKAKKSRDGYLYCESLPHKIVADKTVAFVRQFESLYKGKTDNEKRAVYNKFLNMYLSVVGSLKNMRYNSSCSDSELSKMIFVLSGVSF